MPKFRVGYYQTKRGDMPVFDFVSRQDQATRAKINRFVWLLEMHGPKLGMPYARYLKDGLYELRIRGKNEVRIFYISQVGKNIVMLLHAFNKRSQALPQKEIRQAKKRQQELTEL